MPRPYTVSLSATAYTTAVDLFELTPADDKPIEIVGFEVFQTTELGDAQDEWLPLQIIRGFTSSGSGGSTPTPIPIDHVDTAAGFTAEAGNTTVATTGSNVTVWNGAFNVRAGIEKWFPQGFGPQASQTNTTIILRSSGTPADSISIGAVIYVLEK
jgi:hypothetical protein